MNRIVFFLQGRLVPAARFRGHAIARCLAERGYDVQLRVPNPSVYGDVPGLGSIACRIPGLRPLLSVGALFCRLAQLRHLRRDDFVFFQRPMVELPTAYLESVAAKGRRSLIDFDDAIYLNRGTKRKLSRIFDVVDWIVTGNQTLAEYVNRPSRTRIIPTSVDTSLWTAQATRPIADGEVVVGWTGLSGNYGHLAAASEAIARALAETGARFLIISDAPPPRALAALNPEYVPWSPNDEVAQLSRIDIGVMPLADTAYARGKCAFKLIQYMALGRPALASPVGANAEVVRDGVDGFLPRNDDEWTERLVSLIRDPGLRSRVGERARARVTEAYSLDAVVPRYLDLIKAS